MKFKNVITESLIEGSGLPKATKNILIYIFNNYAMDDNEMSIPYEKYEESVLDLSKKFSISIPESVKAFSIYDTYKDVLFREYPFENFEPKITYDNNVLFLYAVTKYIGDKYGNKPIYSNGSTTMDLGFFDDPENMRKEEQLGTVNGYVSIDFADNEIFMKETIETSLYLHIYLDFNAFDKEKVGYDIIDLEQHMSYIENEAGRRYKTNEVVGTGWIKSSHFKYPEYFTKESVERYGERVVYILKQVMNRHQHDLEGFGDWLQHGGSVFENYKKK
jgi:hypothetical protein